MAAVVLLMAAPMAQSQDPSSPSSPSGRTERADPLDARARVPALVYQSPLASYRRLGEDKRVDWKAANETVNRIGGWRAYAREAQRPDDAASAPGASQSPAAATATVAAPASSPATTASPPPVAASANGSRSGDPHGAPHRGHHGGHHGDQKAR